VTATVTLLLMSGLIESPRTYYRRAARARGDCRERRTSSSPYVLSVTLRDDAGEEWRAVGGGATLADALAFAGSSAPSGRRWTPVAWEDLYGA
jgi:hypothetical protein